MSIGIELIPFCILLTSITGGAGLKSLDSLSTIYSEGLSKIDVEAQEKIRVARAVENREFLESDKEFAADHYEKTVMNDLELLTETLEDYGCEYAIGENSVKALFADHRIVFRMTPDHGYEAGFVGYINRDLMKNTLRELEELYAQNVQQRAYRNIMSRARERGLIFEKEEIKDDNSIVLSFLVE